MAGSVYIDTSVVSNLTAMPSRDIVKAVRQIETIEWWTTQAHHFELFSSDVALEEAKQGNREAAQRRIGVLREMTILLVTLDASSLARALLSEGAVPEVAEVECTTHCRGSRKRHRLHSDLELQAHGKLRKNAPRR